MSWLCDGIGGRVGILRLEGIVARTCEMANPRQITSDRNGDLIRQLWRLGSLRTTSKSSRSAGCPESQSGGRIQQEQGALS